MLAPAAEAINTDCNVPGTAQMTQEYTNGQPDSRVANTILDNNFPSRAASSSVTLRETSATHNGPWTGFKSFIALLRRASDELIPLKSAFDTLSKCTSALKSQIHAREDYKQLWGELDQLFRSLVLSFDKDVPPSMTPVINSLARGIEKEAELVMQKQRMSRLSRVIQAQEDTEVVMGCYQRIKSLLERLALNVDLSVWKTVEEQAAAILIEQLPRSPAAEYRSAQSDSFLRTACTPNTRIDVLEKIKNWAGDESGCKVYWLNGMAGTGKTTIAYSLCEYLAGTRKLAASFFCTRQLPECRDVNRILPSIAYQLSRFSHPFRHALSSVLELDSNAHNQPLAGQFSTMLTRPLQKIEQTFPLDLVVVIDALDECEDTDGVGRMLKVLLTQASNLPIKLLVTSRPEPKILDEMQSELGERARTKLRLHELDRATVQGDIRTYLISELKERVNVEENQIEQLAKRSGALFIYAATVVRYIGFDNFCWAEERVKQILEAPKTQFGIGSREIDTLYTTILKAALEDYRLESEEKDMRMRVLCTIIFAQEPLTVDALAGLLGLRSAKSIEAALRPLRSVLQVSDESGLVTTLHESFPNFLQDQARSERYYCDPRQHHANLAKQCFDLIKIPNPPFNICNLESSYLLDEEVFDLNTRIQQEISQELWYACQYWAAHLEHAGLTAQLIVELEYLLSERYLLWLEIMSLKQEIYYGAGVLHRLKEWLQKSECSYHLQRNVQDCWRFMTGILCSPISRSTPHIYISALSIWPNDWPVSLHYHPKFSRLIEAVGTAMKKSLSSRMLVYDVESIVRSIAYSPDSAYIASGSHHKTVRIWDAHSGQSIGPPLEGHTDQVMSVAYSPSGMHIASGSDDMTIRIWDAHSRQPAGPPLRGHTGSVTSVAYSSDGTYIVSGSNDRTVRTWNAHTGQLAGHPLSGHIDCVTSVAYSPDNAYIVSGSHDRTVHVWNTINRQAAGLTLRGHIGSVMSVAYSPDGAYIASGSSDMSVCIWNAHTGQLIGNPLDGHTGRVMSVAYSPDGAYIASGSHDKTVRIWDTRTRQAVGLILKGHRKSIESVAYSPDGACIAAGSSDNTVRIWDAYFRQPVDLPLEGHAGPVLSAAYSPDSAFIASGSADKNLCIWNAYTRQPVGLPLRGHAGSVMSVAYSPNDTHIASGCTEGTVCIWNTHTRRSVGLPLKGHIGWVVSVAYSPDGARIVSGSDDGNLRLWNAYTGHSLGLLPRVYTGRVSSVAYSPSGAYIISGSTDGAVCIWDTRTEQHIEFTLEGHTEAVTSVACSPDSKLVASASFDKTVSIWDTSSGQLDGLPLEGHEGPVTSVVFSPDGTRIASSSADQTLRIWDARSRRPVGIPLQSDTHQITSVVYSPDGAYIVSGSSDGAAHIWDVRTRQVHNHNKAAL